MQAQIMVPNSGELVFITLQNDKPLSPREIHDSLLSLAKQILEVENETHSDDSGTPTATTP